uniref:Uncharacterized protein n=1 Tax=Oryza meridionalis TaxID=40149 RepID=A0A0E0E5K3_9ORYZ
MTGSAARSAASSTCSSARMGSEPERITWFPKFANPPISWRTQMTSHDNLRIRPEMEGFDSSTQVLIVGDLAVLQLTRHLQNSEQEAHASIFKSEVTVCVRQEAPLKVKKWKNIEKAFPGTLSSIWTLLKGKFPEISLDDYECVMAQVERQYNIRRYNLYRTYHTTKVRPIHVAPEDWQWLIDNLWSDEQFLKRSKQNSINKSKQEMKSLVGTKSIVQIASELTNPETGAWPSAVDVWRAIYMKANGTWSIPNGAEILNNLEEAAETHKERIAAAPIPLAEHFALVPGRKPNHSCGVGIGAVNQGAQERYRIHARAEAADQRASDAQNQAAALAEEVERLTEANNQLRDELRFQCEELNSQKKTVEEQSVDMERLMDQKLEETMNRMMARMGAAGAASSILSSSTTNPL